MPRTAPSVSLVDSLPLLLIGVLLAAAVVTGVHVLLRNRRAQAEVGGPLEARHLASDLTFIVIGLLLAAVSIIGGRSILSVEPSPQGQPFRAGVGIAPDVRPDRNRGFLVGLAAKFSDCDAPVDVTIAFTGTAEYFENNARRLRKRTGFTIAVPSKGLDDVTIGYGAESGGGYEDALTPHLAQTGEEWLTRGSLRTEPSAEHLEVTSIRGSMANWSSHLASLIVKFKANWLVDRGLGTCYLKLPALAGLYSVIGAEDGLGRARERQRADEVDATYAPISDDTGTLFAPYERSLFTRKGLSVIETGKNEILKSEPAANTVAAGLPAIACSQSPVVEGELRKRAADLVLGSGDPATGKSALAIRQRAYSDQVGALDCGGIVTLAEAGAGSQRDLVVLLVGALFSLGVGVAVDFGLGIYRRRSSQSVATTESS